jgi:hypothetical protein
LKVSTLGKVFSYENSDEKSASALKE